MGKGSSGSGQNTVVQNSSPPQIYLDAYQHLLEQAQAQQQQPLTQYPGQLVAPFNAAQNEAFDVTGTAATDLANFGNPAAPYINSAADAYSSATQPLWSGVQQFSPGAVNQYMSPYTQNVVNATQDQFNQSNQIQSDQLTGNAIAKGAFGGDREAVAQAVLAGQQQLNQAPVIAGLYDKAYGQGLGEFNTQQTSQLGANQANAWLNSQAASGLSNLGQQAFNTQLGGINANLAGANANLGIGAIQQAQAQQELNIPYEQFIQQQAYPWQTIGWLGGITQGLGTSAGGNASTNYPSPSVGSQVAGALLGGAGIVGATGGFGSNGWLTNAFGDNSGAAAASSGWSPTGARGGRISHHAGGGIVVPFPQRHARTGGIVADNDDWNDTPLPKRAMGGNFGMPDVSLSYVPSGGGVVNGGGGINGPRMLNMGRGSTSRTSGGHEQSGGDPTGGLGQAGIREGFKSLLKGDSSGALPGSSGTYADPSQAPGGITWNATEPSASATDLSTAAGAEGGMDTAALTSVELGGLDAAEIAALGTTVAEGATAAEIGATVAELAPLILLANRGGRIQRRAPGGLVVPHLSPLQSAINPRPPVDTSYVHPTVGWNPSMTQPPPLPVAAPPPAVLTDTSDPGDGGPGTNQGGDNGGGSDSGGGGDGGGGGGEYRGGFVRRRAPGGIVGYDDGGDVDEVYGPERAATRPRAGILDRGQPLGDLIGFLRQPGSKYTGRNPAPPGRDPDPPPDLGSPEQQYTPGADNEPSPDYDWPPPPLAERGQGIVADGGGEPPMPMTARPAPSADAGIAPPSPYTHDYQPRQSSGRSKEARELAPWMALIEGGAGMLSSRSPNFGVALGEGLKSGAKSYGESRKEADRMAEREDEQRDTGSFHKANLDMQARRFSDAAEQAKKTLQATTKHYADQAEHQAAVVAETGRHNRVQEGKGYWEPVRALTNEDGSPKLDKDGTPMGVWIDRSTNRTEERPLMDPSVRGRGGATAQLAAQLVAQGAAEDTAEALRIIRDPSGKNAQTLQTAQERLALQAAKADPNYQSDPTATINQWRSYYGAGKGGAASGEIAKPSTKAEFDALPSGALYVNPADGQQYRKK